MDRGATRLGPSSDAGAVILRDPGGAVVALTERGAGSATGVVWHQLNTRNCEAATANYSALLGWSFTEQFELGVSGRHQCFAFGAGESSVGWFSDVESRPEVHTHWLFFFEVPALELSLERVRARGGIVSGPMTLPNGVRLAACDDAQGAAFGLIQRRES
jgi:predicted enzyme related to lactoylglutathione lyase